jgi:transposase
MARKRKPHQSTEQKAKIVGMADAGMTPTDIASKLDVGRTTVSAIIARAAARGTVVTAPRSGRPRKNSDRDLRQLRRVLEENPQMKIAEAKDQLATPISTHTARRRAHELGFKDRVSVKKTVISSAAPGLIREWRKSR